MTRSAAHSVTAAPRTLALLAARPLTLSTRTPEGAAPPAVARSGGRPVVAARWPAAPGASPGDTAPSTAPAAGGFGRPAPRPPAPAPARPHVQRATTAHLGPQGKDTGARTTASAAPVQGVPVVRPAPLRPVTAGATPAVPAKSLPVTAPQAPPLSDRPSAAPAPAATVPVVRPRTVAPGPGPAAGPATPVQRAATGTGGADPLEGAEAEEGPARGRSRPSAASSSSSASPGSSVSSAPGTATARRPATPPDDPGLDLDDLARRLLDPVSRLLRTELRRGRERTGRPYDGRR
ncbi:hypothetical protein RKE30_10795 [Streptomyces sp. Li-HN-5-11]|uniref:hypothetical protein n=1 Tax=Streptomyces sp. Li-HN-5-11 TaxID=3075432 RepID=UPI0028A97839|nr:hypothetical protein [Streptomyces sp. Li-HN-5-11]WNM30859.1 hypothetical protein RKE30_10795 [Streptomyces sp. Li-HN-5-11]